MPLEEDGALGDFVVGITDEDRGEGTLPRAVRTHDGMDLTLLDLEVDPLEYFLICDSSVEVTYL